MLFGYNAEVIRSAFIGGGIFRQGVTVECASDPVARRQSDEGNRWGSVGGDLSPWVGK